jgi:hypothetical protein
MNPSFITAGLETMWVIVTRAAIQRSYSHAGAICTRRITINSQSVVKIYKYGVQTSMAILIIQLCFVGMAAAAFIPWLLNPKPVGPAVRVVREASYFTTLLSDSNFSDGLRGLANSPTYAVWQALDLIVRVGEAMDSIDDDVGHIAMDKPKLSKFLFY